MYSQIKKGMHFNLIVGLRRLIKFYLEVLSQTVIEELTAYWYDLLFSNKSFISSFEKHVFNV
jgi:hypothetical protein